MQDSNMHVAYMHQVKFRQIYPAFWSHFFLLVSVVNLCHHTWRNTHIMFSAQFFIAFVLAHATIFFFNIVLNESLFYGEMVKQHQQNTSDDDTS
uniref:Uncharacterized protein n=1 Tax=Leersia perrieri TaxID=77586 RepID=A0A0D9XJC1_9ORYZ